MAIVNIKLMGKKKVYCFFLFLLQSCGKGLHFEMATSTVEDHNAAQHPAGKIANDQVSLSYKSRLLSRKPQQASLAGPQSLATVFS